jgi:hypothetical protein
VCLGYEAIRNNFWLFLIFFLAACTSAPPVNTPPWVGRHKNACLPEAIAMAQGLRKAEIQARVLSIHTGDWGHAVCVYMYPPGKNRLWVWDSYWKSVCLRAWWDSPSSIAKSWMAWRHDTTPIKSSYFHEL